MENIDSLELLLFCSHSMTHTASTILGSFGANLGSFGAAQKPLSESW